MRLSNLLLVFVDLLSLAADLVVTEGALDTRLFLSIRPLFSRLAIKMRQVKRRTTKITRLALSYH